MTRRLWGFALASLLMVNAAVAGEHHSSSGQRDALCPHCAQPCYPAVTKSTETKTCYDVQCKEICVPRVRFPWQSHANAKIDGKDCPPSSCGHVRHVNVLVKRKYECSVCKHSWENFTTKCDEGAEKRVTAPEHTPAEDAASRLRANEVVAEPALPQADLRERGPTELPVHVPAATAARSPVPVR